MAISTTDSTSVTNMSSSRKLGAGQHHPAHQLEHADHRVEPVQQLVRLRDVAERVDDRRDEEADQHREVHDVADVAVLDVDRRQPQAEAERDGEHQRDEQREEEHLDRRITP